MSTVIDNALPATLLVSIMFAPDSAMVVCPAFAAVPLLEVLSPISPVPLKEKAVPAEEPMFPDEEVKESVPPLETAKSEDGDKMLPPIVLMLVKLPVMVPAPAKLKAPLALVLENVALTHDTAATPASTLKLGLVDVETAKLFKFVSSLSTTAPDELSETKALVNNGAL